MRLKYHVICRRKRVAGADINMWANGTVGLSFWNADQIYLKLPPVSSLAFIIHPKK
jgi:hypothetical protein